MRSEPSAVVKIAIPSGMPARADDTLPTIFQVILLNVRNLIVSDRADDHLLLPLPATTILSSGNISITFSCSNVVLIDCTTAKKNPQKSKFNGSLLKQIQAQHVWHCVQKVYPARSSLPFPTISFLYK